MKNSKYIINHLINKPQNSKILQKMCFEKLKSLLPPRLTKSILFMYIKNSTLFFVLNHPGMKMEFDYKNNLIKNLLKKIKDFDTSCADIEIDEVKTFISNKIAPSNTHSKPPRRYKEKSDASFDILSKNQDIKEIFQKIKEEIKKRNGNGT